MMKNYSRWYSYLSAMLILSAASPAFAQQRGGGGGNAGFGGGGGNAGRGTAGSSAATSGRTYPNNGTIGDAYFSIDPETRRVVQLPGISPRF
jgi:hypothetical protein